MWMQFLASVLAGLFSAGIFELGMLYAVRRSERQELHRLFEELHVAVKEHSRVHVEVTDDGHTDAWDIGAE